MALTCSFVMNVCLLVFGMIYGASCNDPEEHQNATELIKSKCYLTKEHNVLTRKCYPAEEHNVTTPDGYILGMHRIPHGWNDTSNKTRPVFFLQHGLLCSSTNWLTNLPHESLAFILADAGFDVWMGNVRGNFYSRMNKFLKPNNRTFWDFSFDEHSLIDLPTMLDHVISVTGQKKVFYVGHSQGTMMGFAGFTRNKTLASYIEKFYALAPVATVKHVKGLLSDVAKIYKPLVWGLKIFGTGEFFPNNEILVKLSHKFCRSEIEVVCKNVLFLICGFNENNINKSRIPVYLAHTPAGTSVQNVVHWLQMVNSGKFQMYNYGSANQDKYHQGWPPCYHLEALSVPTYLFTGDKDYLADSEDVDHLLKVLKPVLGDELQHLNLSGYEHLDFIWGKDAHTKVYSVIVEDAKKLL